MQLALGEERLTFHLESCHSYPCQVSQDVLPSPLAHSCCSHTHSPYMCRASWSCGLFLLQTPGRHSQLPAHPLTV